MNGSNNMEKELRNLAALRRTVIARQSVVEEIETEISESDLGHKLAMAKISLKLVKGETSVFDRTLRRIALENYQETQNKRPINGVTIRIRKHIEYIIAEVVDWAESDFIKTSFPTLMILDTKAFEKLAKSLADTGFAIPATFVDEPQVTITRDLSEYLLPLKDEEE